jgi:hypothetical protein
MSCPRRHRAAKAVALHYHDGTRIPLNNYANSPNVVTLAQRCRGTPAIARSDPVVKRDDRSSLQSAG